MNNQIREIERLSEIAKFEDSVGTACLITNQISESFGWTDDDQKNIKEIHETITDIYKEMLASAIKTYLMKRCSLRVEKSKLSQWMIDESNFIDILGDEMGSKIRNDVSKGVYFENEHLFQALTKATEMMMDMSADLYEWAKNEHEFHSEYDESCAECQTEILDDSRELQSLNYDYMMSR